MRATIKTLLLYVDFDLWNATVDAFTFTQIF